MSIRNTGRASEAIFDAAIATRGKAAWQHRLPDAPLVSGMNGGRRLNVPAQPADRIVCLDGRILLAEVKSTADPTAFRFSLLRRKQDASGVRVTAAGGPYEVFVHSLDRDRWYRVPYALVLATEAAGRRSLRWDEIGRHEWSLQPCGKGPAAGFCACLKS